jgi:hypothetical protein
MHVQFSQQEQTEHTLRIHRDFQDSPMELPMVQSKLCYGKGLFYMHL